jgi:guanylate kinase
MRGVILYGPPASGKDTITRALHELDGRYVLFPRIKCGTGKTSGYRMVSAFELDALRARGEIIWENERYGSAYVIDRSALREHLIHYVPVLHVGQVEAIEAIKSETDETSWVVVSLTIARELAVHRINARGDTDAAHRLRAWEATVPCLSADLTIDTGSITAHQAAQRIRAACDVRGRQGPSGPF